VSTKRLRFVLFAIPLVTAAALTVAADRSRPAGGGVIDPTCTSSLPCIEYVNNSTGPGIRGISLVGNGASGSTKNNSTSSANGRAGVMGNDIGTGSFNFGVRGLSVSGIGVSGNSTNGFGVFGLSTNQDGVVGESTNFAGVDGASTNFVGAAGGSVNGDGVFATSQATPAPGNQLNAAVLGIEGGSGAPFGGAPLIIANNATVGDEMSLDVNGNMILAGSLTTLGTPLIAHHVSKGLVGTYTAQTTQPVTEDFGEAQLIAGQAYVRLDAGFASVTQRGAQYLVFLTPQGDTKGLYVTQKTATGFVVRETNSGRSSIAFDYRIVAIAADSAHQRLPQLRDTLYHGRSAFPRSLMGASARPGNPGI
jgi:hypothetical protein